MSDLRMELIQGQLRDIEENVRSIKATWDNTITTLDNIKTSLKADRQKAIDETYQNGFEAGQHEATTLEYQQGLEEGKKQARAQAHLDVCHDIERVAHGNYQKGLDDAWGTIIKIALIPYAERSEIFDGQQDILSIVQKFSPSEVIAKLREYEQQKADDEIKVGDEVDYKGMTKYVVTGIVDDDTICGFSLNGLWNANTIKEVTKTGRHFPQVAELLKAMIGGAE